MSLDMASCSHISENTIAFFKMLKELDIKFLKGLRARRNEKPELPDEDIRALIELKNKGIDINAQADGLEKTALHSAVRIACLDIVQALIKAGIGVSSRDGRGKIPLHCAAMYDRDEIARELIASGSDVNSQDGYGRTPLHLAVCYSTKVTKILLDTGARTDIRAHGTYIETITCFRGVWCTHKGYISGQTPLDYARRRRAPEVTRLLSEAISPEVMIEKLLQEWLTPPDDANSADAPTGPNNEGQSFLGLLYSAAPLHDTAASSSAGVVEESDARNERVKHSRCT